MPCSECGHLLIANHGTEKLLCPNCLGMEIADRDIIEKKIDSDRQLLRDENLISLMKDYKKGNLLLRLIEHLNKISHDLLETRALKINEFSYINYLINIIYPEDESTFGTNHLERGDELDEEMDLLLSTQANLVVGLNHIEDQFRLCLEYPVPMADGRFLFGDYDVRDTEYRYCFIRNLTSLSGGWEENIESFDKTHEKIRTFEKPSSEEIGSLEDFADTFYEFILSMLFIASWDDIVGEIYSTSMPDHVSVFDLADLFEQIDEQFTNEAGSFLLQDNTLAMTDREGLAQAGEDTFGDDWEDVREHVVISKNNHDAHPFLFELTVSLPYYQQQGRPSKIRECTRIIYPQWYTKLLRHQIFPLLRNGDKESGHEILSTVATQRGREFEENLCEYLSDQGFKCYHSAEIPGEDSSEIDLLVVNDEEGELWFIECKYLMPELGMNTAKGIEALNGKFDHKVFNIEAEDYAGSPTGLPFPEKVETWLGLDPGERFTAQSEEGQTTEQKVQSNWQDLKPRKLVVSNLVPSYVEKETVEFRTDMELREMIEEEDNVYSLSSRQQNS